MSIAGKGALIVGLCLLAGCVSAPLPGDAFVNTRDPKLLGTRVRDQVLWQCRFGLAALRAGEREEAKARFDDAIRTLGGIHAGTAGAATVTFHAPDGRALRSGARGLTIRVERERDTVVFVSEHGTAGAGAASGRGENEIGRE